LQYGNYFVNKFCLFIKQLIFALQLLRPNPEGFLRKLEGKGRRRYGRT